MCLFFELFVVKNFVTIPLIRSYTELRGQNKLRQQLSQSVSICVNLPPSDGTSCG